MPTYEYECKKCGVFEVEQRITEDALKTCPTCKKPISRLISAPAFHLKGGGWYKDLYSGSSNTPKSSESSASSSTSSSTTTSSESATSAATKEKKKP